MSHAPSAMKIHRDTIVALTWGGMLWGAVALLFATHGVLLALYRQTPQPWWPSLGYAMAIFSIWWVLTPAIAVAVRRLEAGERPIGARLALYGLGLPVTAALHVGLFVLIYWPVYNDGGRIATRWAMGERMFLPNLDTNALFYLLVVGFTCLRTRRSPQAGQGSISEITQPEKDAQELRIRSRGRFQTIVIADIDWIGAAGNYAEVHVGAAVVLVETSLTALQARLPSADFARIHRQTLIPVKNIAGIRGLGRGDAMVRLRDGQQLRMSRRYRSGLSQRLGFF